jgi:predicted RNA methylase
VTKHREETFSLARALDDPGFTPRKKDVADLLDRIAEGADDGRAEKALLRVQGPLGEAIAARAASAQGEVLARLVQLAARAITREPDAGPLTALALRSLEDVDPRVRRAAAKALGKSRDARAEDALLARLEREAEPRASRDVRVAPAILEALGNVGGERSREALARRAPEGDRAKLERARLKLDRSALRSEASRARLDRSLGAPVLVSFRCRRGVAPILAAEIADRVAVDTEPRQIDGDPERVDLVWSGRPDALFGARTALSFGFAVEVGRQRAEELATTIARALSSDPARRILTRLTEGPIRFRVAWAEGGKRRKTTWDLATEIQRRAPELVNDPTESVWEIVVRETEDRVRLELVPKSPDPRFVYRRRDVPAASHPTLAAALVRASRPRDEDVVWDPFVGSGGELCERALAGPVAMLVGSDVDERALAVARENLDAAGARDALLRRADARSFDPRAIGGRARYGMTAIVTNPPMGRRVGRSDELEELLVRIVHRAAEILAPGGRLVWLSPQPQATRAAARAAGLTLARSTIVDMGGFSAELQVLARPESAPRSR